MDQAHYIIERGLRARALMQDDAFNLVLKELAGNLEAQIVSSEPHETKTRESAYFQHRGLQQICNTLATWVQIGETTQAEVQAQNEGTETE